MPILGWVDLKGNPTLRTGSKGELTRHSTHNYWQLGWGGVNEASEITWKINSHITTHRNRVVCIFCSTFISAANTCECITYTAAIVSIRGGRICQIHFTIYPDGNSRKTARCGWGEGLWLSLVYYNISFGKQWQTNRCISLTWHQSLAAVVDCLRVSQQYKRSGVFYSNLKESKVLKPF